MCSRDGLIVALRGPQRPLQPCRAGRGHCRAAGCNPWGEEVNRIFCGGVKNRRPSPPSPTFQGLGPNPKASQTPEGSLGQGKIGPGGRGFTLKSQDSWQEQFQTGIWTRSPVPTP